MPQSSQSYSARDAIANSLRAYQQALQTLQAKEQRAAADQRTAVDHARHQRDAAKQQARADRDRQKAYADSMLAEADAASHKADQDLLKAGLGRIAAPITYRPAGSSSTQHPKQELQRAYSQLHAAETDLRHALDLLAKVRTTLIARLRKALGLPP